MPGARVMCTDRSCSAHAHGCMRDFWAWLRHAWWWFHNCHRSTPVLRRTLQLPVVLAMLLHFLWEPRIQSVSTDTVVWAAEMQGANQGAVSSQALFPQTAVCMYRVCMYVWISSTGWEICTEMLLFRTPYIVLLLLLLFCTPEYYDCCEMILRRSCNLESICFLSMGETTSTTDIHDVGSLD